MNQATSEAIRSLNTLELPSQVSQLHIVTNAEDFIYHARGLAPELIGNLAVGGGLSNTVLGDHIPQDLLLFRDGRITAIEREASSSLVRVDGSCSLDVLAESMCTQGIPGTEMLSGIPGTVGAALVQNVAAYGQELSRSFVEATAFDTHSGSLAILSRADFAFGYRTSALKTGDGYTPRFIVLDVALRFEHRREEILYQDIKTYMTEHRVDLDDLQARRHAVLAVRQSKGMVVDGANWVPSAGSFFLSPVVSSALAMDLAERVRGEQFASSFLSWYNPDRETTRVPAALVLRAAGFMNGDRWGAVGLSPHHILAICTAPGASGSDVFCLSEYIVSRVREALGVTLKREVRVLGELTRPSVEGFLAQNPFVSGQTEPDWARGMGLPHKVVR